MIISINTDNAAFQDGNANAEIMRIIAGAMSRHDLSDPFICENDRAERYPLRDINGNKCGFIEY